jgi:hypothetical protein
MTQAKLDRLCGTWKRRLRLQDWSVSVSLTPADPNPEAFGSCKYDVLNQKADIEVYNDADAELTLVHELLHLRLMPFGNDDTNERQAAMNLLADSLVRGYGKSK